MSFVPQSVIDEVAKVVADKQKHTRKSDYAVEVIKSATDLAISTASGKTGIPINTIKNWTQEYIGSSKEPLLRKYFQPKNPSQINPSRVVLPVLHAVQSCRLEFESVLQQPPCSG